ncbi:alanyl-tRNA editing protein AlaX [Candidatus Woesearchaeota archaeon]|nr:alanyl-tRNA editing protein AlaX [Candidatus Woesearchaeota archaeon]|tara:strand:- start:11655 stop:12365 length:711 start_codon:yes stop_codon:yes gene_type:complete
MTQTVFLDDCYIKELDAEVASVEGSKVELDKSIFCYQGGGQPSDQGTITAGNEQYKVIDVRKEQGKIMHHLDKEGLQKEDKVHCVLDWKRRHVLMRYHTALHILSSIVHQQAGALITGGQIDLEKTRIDFSLEDFDREKVAEYVKEANNAIKKNMLIKMYFMKREEALKRPGMVKLANAVPPQVENLRIVEIGDVDTQADGGTHVANTSEIGQIEVLEIKNKGKSNRRVYFKLVQP